EVEGFFDDAWEVVDVAHEVGVFDDGHGEAQDVCFLEGVHTERAGDGLSGDDDHGHGVHLCGHHAGDGIGCTGPRCDENDPRFSTGTGVAVGHVCTALFVAAEHEVDIR